jgi:hypothetical protein
MPSAPSCTTPQCHIGFLSHESRLHDPLAILVNSPSLRTFPCDSTRNPPFTDPFTADFILYVGRIRVIVASVLDSLLSLFTTLRI